MPTFRKDIKIGTQVPLIKTDDISNDAVSEEKLSKAFRKKVDEIGEMTKEEMEEIVKSSELINVGASLKKARKKRKQIIIGKAIKPTSVSRSDVENWYAFIENPCLVVENQKGYDDLLPEVTLFIRTKGEDEYDTYKLTNIYDGEGGKQYRLNFGGKYSMYKVDRYERRNNTHEIFLTRQTAPKTLKGTSLTQEWLGRKRINNKKIHKDIIENDLMKWIANKSHSYDLEYRRITSSKKTRAIRTMHKRYPNVKDRCRKEVSWLNKLTGRKSILASGLFKVRSNRLYTKTNWQTIYVRTVGTGKETIIKDIIFK